MGALADILLPLAEKYGPELIKDFEAAFQKKGYSTDQINAVFALVQPYKDLGIDPNAPVKPETTP